MKNSLFVAFDDLKEEFCDGMRLKLEFGYSFDGYKPPCDKYCEDCPLYLYLEFMKNKLKGGPG